MYTFNSRTDIDRNKCPFAPKCISMLPEYGFSVVPSHVGVDSRFGYTYIEPRGEALATTDIQNTFAHNACPSLSYISRRIKRNVVGAEMISICDRTTPEQWITAVQLVSRYVMIVLYIMYLQKSKTYLISRRRLLFFSCATCNAKYNRRKRR